MHNKHKHSLWLKRLAMAILAVLFVIAAGFDLLFQIDYTQGVSMDPTLRNEQMLVVWRPTAMKLLHVPYQRGDIVVAANESNKIGLKRGDLLVKRLVGLPKEQVGITRTSVLIDHKTLAEPYVTYPMDNSTYAYGGERGGGSYFRTPGFTDTVTLKADQYYIMGDNRPQSADSRWFGPIHRSQLQGKVASILGLFYDHPLQRALPNIMRALPFFLLVALIVVSAVGQKPYKDKRAVDPSAPVSHAKHRH